MISDEAWHCVVESIKDEVGSSVIASLTAGSGGLALSRRLGSVATTIRGNECLQFQAYCENSFAWYNVIDSSRAEQRGPASLAPQEW